MCTHDTIRHSSVGGERSEEESQSLEDRADRYVQRIEGFYAHLASYVGVNALLVGINLFTSPDVFWAIWPILGWGVKVAIHAVAVFGVPGRADWRERTRNAFLRRHGDRSVAGETESARTPEGETERLRRRIEHLEAIVTSADWDLVIEETPDRKSREETTAVLAERVVQS